jgi:hypothetical protein
MTPSDALYAAASSAFGLIVRGASAKALRSARNAIRDDPALAEIAILGPDQSDQVWLVRKDVVRTTLHGARTTSTLHEERSTEDD